ncbi:MAG TPA: serine/threonine-protein kinase, partial [Planctomycetota bacterium]|nr:serine/threonine-protein kinase [Planctomycetota bacterium]
MHGDTGVSRGEHSPGRDGGDTLPTDELEELVAACVEAEVRGDQAAVEALLSARPSLAPAARAQIDDLRRSGLLEEQPEQIGPYRIRSLLGRGGMGAVYLAEQEQPVRRLVAVKLIKRGMDTGEVAVRFAAERQALALMSHEHIAKMFDAGATPDGRPYFVMEYVPGVPITEYSDAHRLDLDQRLAMFLQVCAGVRHAHLKGIVHRDLKPSNVLVTEQDGRPVPKIIDFGIAKAVDQRLTADSLRTTAGMLLGTPEYMSPEQAGGDPFDVDLRTDVYSLGVILYELLTGTLPFAPQRLRRDYGQLIDILRSEDPPPPSRQLTRHADTVEMARRRSTTPTLLRRRVRRELDWICCRAMEKERNRRYASVDELAADIRRYLAHEPVLAGPPSDLYRIRKFVRRYRVQVGAAVLVLAAIVAALGISLNALAKEARANALAAQALAGETKARAAAEHDFQRALDAVEQLMHRVAEETLDNLPHMTQVRRQLAADAAAFCR